MIGKLAAVVLAGGLALGACSWIEPHPPNVGTFVQPEPVLTLSNVATVAPDACTSAGLRVAADVAVPRYDRAKVFGGWRSWTGHRGQDTRDRILDRDLREEQLDARGEATYGVLTDPYTGATVVGDPDELVQIDHVYPEHLALATGAANWSAEERREFANDDGNLLAVSARGKFGNEAKGERGPEAFLPPVHEKAYVALFATTARKYHLTISPARKAAIDQVCRA